MSMLIFLRLPYFTMKIVATSFLLLLWIQPMMTALPFATVDTRTNFCSLGQRIANGTALMTTVLNGRTINVGVDPSVSTNSNPLRSRMITFDPISGIPNRGHIFTSLTQIATTLGVTINWVQLPPQGSQSDLTYVTSCAELGNKLPISPDTPLIHIFSSRTPFLLPFS